MGEQQSANGLTARLEELAVGLADPDCDIDALAELEEELLAAREPELIPRLEEHLVAAVEARNWYARHVLAGILAETAGRSSLPVLLRAFCRDLGDDQDSLSTTLYVFAQEDPVAARGILVPWADDPDQDLRRAAIWLLGFVPDPVDLALLTRAAHAPDERIRTATVGTLGSHGANPAAVDLLMSLLDDPSTQVRVSALSSLGFLKQHRTLPKIRRLADDSTPLVRAWVAIALGRFPASERSESATARVLDRLALDPDPYVRESADNARRLTPGRG
ncbi:HEAT repeat domain-containing protein [Streptomyces sp. NPDC059909]|uniref:HEAT repeat domain-containing protein n=1 Tax=Streptomyces sp. NPDC059909 TaxID=3346998 RepID=UPI00365D22C7